MKDALVDPSSRFIVPLSIGQSLNRIILSEHEVHEDRHHMGTFRTKASYITMTMDR